MVMVKIDSNAILVKPMKSCKDAEMIGAYDVLLLRLKRAGIVPKKHVLDNKVSENMKNHIRDKCKFDMELVPPGCHQRNTAEVAIRNLKPIFSVYSQAYPTTFPLAYGTGYSHKQKSLSTSYANLMPLPPYQHTRISVDPLTATKCRSHRWDAMLKFHEKTDKQGTWAFHSVDGWYLFTSPEHYRTHNCHIKHIKSERLSDTVQFQHKRITNPSITHADKVMHALAECIKALQGMKGKDKTSQATKDLQQIVDATQVHIKAQPNHLETMATPTDSIQIQQALRVQTPTREPIPSTNDTKRITHSMTMAAPVLRVPNIRVPTCKPTANPMEATRRERVRKRRMARLRNRTTTITVPPQIRTRSTSSTPSPTNTFAGPTIQHTATITTPRLRGSCDATTMTLTWHCLTHTANQKTRE